MVLLPQVRTVKMNLAKNLNVEVLRISRKKLILERYAMLGNWMRRVLDRNRNGTGGCAVTEYARTLLVIGISSESGWGVNCLAYLGCAMYCSPGFNDT
jgi:hypothetical protein